MKSYQGAHYTQSQTCSSIAATQEPQRVICKWNKYDSHQILHTSCLLSKILEAILLLKREILTAYHIQHLHLDFYKLGMNDMQLMYRVGMRFVKILACNAHS